MKNGDPALKLLGIRKGKYSFSLPRFKLVKSHYKSRSTILEVKQCPAASSRLGERILEGNMFRRAPKKATSLDLWSKLTTLSPVLVDYLRDPDEDVALSALKVLVDVALCPSRVADPFLDADSNEIPAPEENPDFTKLLTCIVDLIHKNSDMLDTRAPWIIRQLCSLAEPKFIYKYLSFILYFENDVKFIEAMVGVLDTVLTTSPELFSFRIFLRCSRDAEMVALFRTMYKTWCYRPAAALTLCLLGRRYEQAVILIELFRDLRLTDCLPDFASDLNRLVQRVESDVFTNLRFHLLDPACNQPLFRTLYAVSDLIPQSEATAALSQRLQTLHACQISIPDLSGPLPDEDLSSEELTDEFHKVYTIRLSNQIQSPPLLT